jgi:phosphoribosyl 1,2-cyclic phosphodiesterase
MIQGRRTMVNALGGPVRLCLLASGSKGNSVFIETGETRLLVDAGLAGAEITSRLASIGVEASSLHGILISHEHGDHVRGAGTLARRLKIPVCISYPTHQESQALFRKAQVVEFESGYQFSFRDLLIDPFPITHDSVDPVGFVIESCQGQIGIATDLGIVTRLVVDKLKTSNLLVLESNHDEEMLLNGPYPWHLKQRIKSRHGHLSNNEAATLLDGVIHEKLAGVLLAHLSEVNNDPGVALTVAQEFFATQNICDPRLLIGNQYRVSEILSL